MLPTQPEEIADLKNLVVTPIALGERLFTRMDFRPYFERRAIDIAQPDASFSLRHPNLSRLTSSPRSLTVVELVNFIVSQLWPKHMMSHWHPIVP